MTAGCPGVLRSWRAYKFLLFVLVVLVCGSLIITDFHLASLKIDQTGTYVLQLGKNQIQQRLLQQQPQQLQQTKNCSLAPYGNLTEICPHCFTGKVARFVNDIREMKDSPQELEDYFRPREQVVQPLITNYLIEPSQDFVQTPTYLLVIQPSKLDRGRERDVVRQTWASVVTGHPWPKRAINAKVKLVFVVSRPLSTETEKKSNQARQRSDSQWSDIKLEAVQHDDILYLDMIDSYKNLTLKLLSAFKWVKDHMQCFKFLLKVDMDTFVNLPLLIDTLLIMENTLMYSVLGHLDERRIPVQRKGRWAMGKDQYPLEKYPYYSSGGAYVISSQAVFKMAEIAPYMTIFEVEDAFITGVLRRTIQCRIFSLGIFLNFIMENGQDCEIVKDQRIAGEYSNLIRHKSLWNMLKSNRSRCEY